MLSLLLLACTCTPGEPLDPAVQNLVLVTLDTVRADHLGSYGHEAAKTPWLDDLAARGQRYDRAYSVLPLTIPSHASMFTGLYPFHHGIRSNGDAILAEHHVTLAEHLQQAGFQTGASVAAFVTSRTWGFAQGFDAFFDRLPDSSDTWHAERSADAVVDDALAWVAKRDPEQPTFLWVHVYDAHFPYPAPEEGLGPYDSEITRIDEQLARLDQGLKEAGMTDPTWVVVGDHGEALGDHRENKHGLFTYDATQRVPFLVAGPGVEPGVHEKPVSITDVLPTALSLMGVAVPGELDGIVLPGSERPVYMEAYGLVERFGYAPHVTIVDGDLKLIDKPIPELYLYGDEQDNLAEQRPEDVARLRQLLAALDASPPTKGTVELDPSTLAQLEALGYVAGSEIDVDLASLPDPIEHRDAIGRMLRAELKLSKEDIEGAIELFEEVRALDPSLAAPYNRLIRLYDQTGQLNKAQQIMTAALERFPDNVSVLRSAATLNGKQGRHEQVLELTLRALALSPEDIRAAELHLSALGNLGRSEDFVSFAQEFLERNPDSHNIAGLLGIHLFDRMDFEGAVPWLLRAAEPNRPRRGVLQRLATTARANGELGEALTLIERELELYPRSRKARIVRLNVLAQMGEREEVVAEADRILESQPSPDVYLSKATSLFDLDRIDEAHEATTAGLALAPNDADLTLMLANILKKQGKEEEALKTKARAEKLHAQRKANK